MESGTNVFERGDIRLTYFKLALPAVVSMLISVVYNIADTYFIAQTQNTLLVAGVSLCAPVFTITMAFGNVYGQGGMSLLSRMLGRHDDDACRRISAFCFYMAIATGLLLTAVMLLFKTPLLTALGADAETLSYAGEYFTILGYGAPFILLSFVHMNLLRSEGYALQSTIGSVAGLVLNIILDPIMISVLGWGAAGAALASVIGYIVTDLFYLIFVLKKSRLLSVSPAHLRISGREAGDIFSVGVSAALANWMSSLCLIITNQFLLPYGNDKIAAMGIAQKVILMALMLAIGFSFGGAPIIGYYYGGQRYGELKKLLRFIFLFVTGLSVVLSAILFAVARPIVGIFLTDADVIAAGTAMLCLQLITAGLAAVIQVITVCYQAAGKALQSLLISLCRQGIVFLAVIAVASRVAGYQGILWSQAIADVITLAIAVALFARFYRSLKEPEA